MKKTTVIIFMIIQSILLASAQTKKTAGIAAVYTQGMKISAEAAGSMVRIEAAKANYFTILDNLDMEEAIANNEIEMSNCLGRECLLKLGKAIGADKIISCSIENMGKNIAITIKILDVGTGNYDVITLQEFLNLEGELQSMIQITLNKALGIENNPELLNTLIYYNQPVETPITYIKNSGPRMGVAILGGELNTILTSPESEGGYDLFPVLSQIGYQIEGAYLSAGNFQGLVEGLFLLTGLEQSLFNPSFAFMHGIRNSKNGFEIGFGPTFRGKRVAKGYYDDQNRWHLQNEWTNVYDTNGVITNPNPYEVIERIDKRGSVIKISTGWVWAIGKTFHSGYLNIPVNAYFSHNKEGWYTGLSVGFNMARKDQ